MKHRIVEYLVTFSKKSTSEVAEMPMMKALVQETRMDSEQIRSRSQAILKNLLHNYAAFSVETIDSFNHRLIRTFARDLKLNTNFEVFLNTKELLAEAVDLLLSKAGEDKKTTNVLLDFALEKADDDKSWNISQDIAKASKLLYDENDVKHVSILKQKTLDDFITFKNQLVFFKKKLSEEIETLADNTLRLLDENGLEHSDFLRNILPNHFLKLKAGNYDAYGNHLQENLEEGKGLYTVKTTNSIVLIIDKLIPKLLANYLNIKEKVFRYDCYDSILKNLNPLSVINLVNREIETIKKEKNILPISEFNSIINKEIKNQPVPFIYERLGEKYRHYFIDEFQDTSKLQWENLIPLIDDSLSQEIDQKPGSLLLVGDVKQSIYRWRGGLPEQFLDLLGDKNPFQQEKTFIPLDTNYRSCEEIIDFNNSFFTYVSSHLIKKEHQKLYRDGSNQKKNHKKGGYVKIEFIEKQNKAEKTATYSEMVFETIRNVKAKGFSESDICILTRKNDDGINLAAYLMAQGISVISSETLLLQSSPLIQILVLALRICIYPNDETAKINLLDKLHDHLRISEEKHTFFSKFLECSEAEFSEKLKQYDINFSISKMRIVSIYEAFEYCIENFKISAVADAYLFGFMDLVYEFEQQPKADKISFLDFWESKREETSISTPDGTNAVKLMSIHKSKGLEFPIVIFPFADIAINDGRNDKLWYVLENEDFSFKEAQINYKAAISEYGEVGARLYNEHLSQLVLDNVNLLYVTLTRAVEKLYIFSEFPSKPKDGNPSTYNQLFNGFLKHKNLWNDDQLLYEFGEDSEKTQKENEHIAQTVPRYFSSDPRTHGLRIVSKEMELIQTEAATAIFAGNLLHDTMARIFSEVDMKEVLNELEARAIVSKKEFETVRETIYKIVQHPDLKKFFDGSDKVYNERNICTKDGEVLRPDRINIREERTASLIDYKTGSPKNWHSEQLSAYANALTDMGYFVSEKILIYSNKDEILINKV